MSFKQSLIGSVCLIVFLAEHLFATPVSRTLQTNATAQIAVLEFGASDSARQINAAFVEKISNHKQITILDHALAESAARGAGYDGSLNLTVEAARNLGSSIGCDFYILGRADTVRRSSFAVPVYYESYLIVFLVSARTGKLMHWERVNANEAAPEIAEAALLKKIGEVGERFAEVLVKTDNSERRDRAETAKIGLESGEPVELPDETDPRAARFRVPLPYKRLRPVYTAAASDYLIEAAVDAAVEINEQGVVTAVEIVRWAGFGLDEETAATIRKMTFRPALRDGTGVKARFLLRYNFRRRVEEAENN